jgi:UDP-GlcNAc:undecaprenyl-phosphate GlcNAc-1-phosphate transferase
VSPLLAAGLAFLLGLPLVGLAARLAPALGLMDVPGPRSSHRHPRPRSGGLAVFATLVVVGAASFALDGDAAAWNAALRYAAPAAAFFAIGIVDDRRPLAPVLKFAGQAAAATLAVGLGLRWGGEAHGPFGALTFGGWTPLLTGLWIVAAVNLVNLLDGIDLITCGGALVVLAAAAGGGAGPGPLYAVAAGATLALAFHNVTPARVFPGDGATHLLGFLVGSAALEWPGDPATSALPWALASAPLVPGVLDVAGGIVAKLRRGLPWWSPHRLHLYQRLTAAGWPHGLVALRFSALSAAALVLVGRVAPAAGLAACLAGGAVLLALHLGHAAWLARRGPAGS